MEIIFEILLEAYMELMLLIVPEGKGTKRYRRIAKTIALCVLLLVFAAFFAGLFIRGTVGILLIAFSIVLSLAQIVMGIVLYRKHH